MIFLLTFAASMAFVYIVNHFGKVQDRATAGDLDLSKRLRRLEQAMGGIWRTGNGTEIAIVSMSTLHVLNAIAYLEELPAKTCRQWEQLRLLRAERNRRARNIRMMDREILQGAMAYREMAKAVRENHPIERKGVERLKKRGPFTHQPKKDGEL